MGTVFCRGCGKDIHDTAAECPHCGTPQWPPQASSVARNGGKLVGWAMVWTIVFWFAELVVAGMFAGILNPEDASAAGERIGEVLGGPLFVVALCASGWMTFAGALPGTAKQKNPSQLS